MTKLSRKGNPDLIHANNIEVLRKKNIPFVLNVHHVGHLIYENVRHQNLFTWFQRVMLKKQANNSDKVIVVSKNTYFDMKKIGVKEDKMIIIPNGVDLDKFKPIERKKRKKFIITHVSRISPEKRQNFSIKSVKELIKEKNIKNVELNIVGFISDRNYFKSLKKHKFVKFFTNLNDTVFIKKIQNSDLVVFPTGMSEGFGLVVLEAMACGIPVIASEQDAIKEAGGEACIYFKQDSLDDFKDKIMKLYKNKKLRDKLSKKGLKRVKRFSWDKVYEKYKKVYEELLK